ncbi:MAG: hypothetical protein QME52_08620 [Bacteroidota bacterium]|nr:hypothetical protein [Bacteroidota bacterium]
MDYSQIVKQKYNIGLALLLAFSAFYIYGQVLHYPFIQDDWCMLHAIETKGGSLFLTEAFSVHQHSFYRPLGHVYIFLLNSVFHLNPFGFHLIAIVIHICNSLLLVLLSSRLIGNISIAWFTGFLYAIAVTIHMDSLSWIVGIYDLGGAFFFFLSFYLYVRERITLSSISFLFALLTKESTIILPFILFFYQLIKTKEENKTIWDIPKILISLRQHIFILVIYGILRVPAIFSIDQAINNPYALKLTGPHVISNLTIFCSWCIEALNPFFVFPTISIILLVGLTVLIVIIQRKRKSEYYTIIFLISWMIIGLLPVLFLENHFYRYYLTYSLPAFIIFVCVGLQVIISIVKSSLDLTKGVLVALTVISFLSSKIYYSDLEEQGFNTSGIQGSNNLIRKKVLIQMVREYLFKEYPTMPESVNLIFDWLPTDAFCRNAGPRMWYKNSTINVYEIGNVGSDSIGIYLKNPQSRYRQRKYLDPQKTILLQFHGDHLREVKIAEIYKP